MTATTPKIINTQIEQKIRALANSFGIADTPLKSETTKQIELQFSSAGRTEFIYIDRKKGANKETLHAVIRPEFSDTHADKLCGITNIQQKMHARDKTNPVVQSSGYKGFKNKLISGEHRGHTWAMPSNDGLTALEAFFTVLSNG